MKKVIGVIAVLLTLFVTASAGLSSALAVGVGDVKVVSYGTNAAGTDTTSNRNAEFVRLRNTTASPIDVEGWVLHDTYQNNAGDWGNRYTFKGSQLPAGSPFKVDHDSDAGTPEHFVMPVGSEVYVYNGSGVDTTPTSNTAAMYRNFKHMWNNSGDTIYLRTSADASSVVARVKYSPYRVDITQ